MKSHNTPIVAPSKAPLPRAESRPALPTMPTSSFNVHAIKKDGDCFFNAMATALKDSGVDTTAGGLRKVLANYIDDKGNRGPLSRNEAVMQAGGVAAVKQKLETPGHWNSDAGDLVVSLAAQALGREIHVLQPNSDNGQQYREIVVVPAHTGALPGENRSSIAGEAHPPIYLLQTNNAHYDLLEPKSAQQQRANSSIGAASSDQATLTAGTSNAKSLANLVKETKPYVPFIGRELLAGKSPRTASTQQLQNGLAKLERIFDRYDDAVTRVDAGKGKGISAKPNSTVAEARTTKHGIEDMLTGNNQKRFGIKEKKGRQEALKAMNLAGGRIALELQWRNQQGSKISSASKQKSTDVLERLPKKLQQPSFKHDAKRLEKDTLVLTAATSLSAEALSAPVKRRAARPVTDQHPVMASTKRYKPFINTELLKGVNLNTASPEQLQDGIKAFAKIVDLYSDTAQKIEFEESKGSQLKDKALLKKLQYTKQSIEDSFGDNTSRRNGFERREGRQGALKAMSLVHSRLNLEIDKSQGDGADPAIIQESKKLTAAISQKLDRPGFSFSAAKLKADISAQLVRKEVGVEKVAIMQGYIDAVGGTLNMLSSEANTQGAAGKAWQSKRVDDIVSQVQSVLDELKESLKPTLNAAELAGVGMKTNQILEKGYTKIAKHAKSQIKANQADTSKVSALEVLRDTSLLAAQHHHSSRQVGTVTKAAHEFAESIPIHVSERIGTVASPGLERSVATTGSVGVEAGFDLAKFGVSSVTPGDNGEDDTFMPLHKVGATAGASITGRQTRSAAISRGNDLTLISSNLRKDTIEMSAEASAGFSTKAVEAALGDNSIGAKISGTINRTKITGDVSLSSTAQESFGSHHASKLTSGQTAGGSIGRFAKLTGIDDSFGSSKLRDISATAIKLGYDNDRQVAVGFHALLGDDVTTAYDRSGKGPLAEMFTSTSLEGKPATEGQRPKGVMSALFPDPGGESDSFETLGWKGKLSAQANAMADALGAATSLSTSALKVGVKTGLSGTVGVEDTNFVLSTAEFPHDIFNPDVTLSPRRSVECAQEYFSKPTAANLILSKPVAQAMGFENTADYFTAVANSFGDDGPQIAKVNSEQLTQSYRNFENDVNLIDQFFLQPERSLRESKLPELQDAIKRINENYGAKLPDITEGNMGEFTSTNKKGKTESYQQFQDTAVAIISGFSAAAGAMKLMVSQGKLNPEQKARLEESSASLLASIESRGMPWNKMEMVRRSAYVRKLLGTPFSHKVTTSVTGEALAFHGRKGGDYNVSGFIKNGAEALAGSSSTGFGAKVTQTRSKSLVNDNVNDPGQTGITRTEVTTRQQRIGPFKDFRRSHSWVGKVKQAALEAATFKKEISTTQTASKTQGYTARPSDDQNAAREFNAYISSLTSEERGVRAGLGGTIPIGPLSVSFGASRSQDKSDSAVTGFTYGNDVGALALLGHKLFSDYKISIKDVAAQISSSEQVGGPAFNFLDTIDDRLSNSILGDQRYDHMSSIMSKFRNSGFVETTKNGETSVQFPTVTEGGMATPASSVDLHNSKGQALDLTADKKYVDRSGFFGYAVARYDDNLIQDSFKHYLKEHGVSFPDVTEIDGLLSKKVPSAAQHGHKGEPIDQTRQQWLKSATKEERKDFYQNDTDGQQMLLNYLKVLSFANSINRVILQNNTFQVVHDQEQIERVDRLFVAPQPSTPAQPSVSTLSDAPEDSASQDSTEFWTGSDAASQDSSQYWTASDAASQDST